MKILRYPVPDALHGSQLRSQIVAATRTKGRVDVSVTDDPPVLQVIVPDRVDEATVAGVLAAHVPAPDPVTLALARADAGQRSI